MVFSKTAAAFDIYVDRLGDPRITLSVQPSDTIEDVKTAVESVNGVPPSQQMLKYNGVVLADGRTLSDYNIQQFAVLNLFSSPTVMLSTGSQSPVAGPFPMTVTFSAAVTGFMASSIIVGNGTVSNFQGSGTAYTFDVTPTANGNVTVDIPANVAVDSNNQGNAAATQFSITAILPILTVTSVSPSTGPTTGGTQVTITGTGFTSATAVTFGGTPATNVSVVNATTITATTPVGIAGPVNVVVTTAGGTGIGTDLYTYGAVLPTVTSVSPSTGPTTGGTRVTITGTGFTGATALTFGGVAATALVVVSDTQITATTPAGAEGATTIAVVGPSGTGSAAGAYTFVAGTPETAFNEYKDDIKRIIQDQAEKRLITLMTDNKRMMQDARTRFIGFAGDGAQAGLTANGFDAIAFDVDGTVDVSGDLSGVVAASSGELLGQTGMVNGANWRLSGNFDVLLDGDQSLASFDARVAREQFLTRNVLWGAFGGGQFSNSDITDSFTGSETTWQLYGGTYAVGKLTSNLFADAYASAGYGWSDLSMNNDVLALDSNYGTFTWQVGGSLAGLIEMERFSLLPTVSVSYGNSNLGEIDFTAQTYGLSDGVSLDADYVAMGVLRLTPEIRIPLGADATTQEGVVLGLLPSFICQQVVADDSETDCGWGVGAELMQAGSSGLGQFSGKIDFEQVGGISRIGGQIGYSIQF